MNELSFEEHIFFFHVFVKRALIKSMLQTNRIVNFYFLKLASVMIKVSNDFQVLV